MMYKQSGIALLQALLVTMVITILAVSFSYSSRDQVDIASTYVSRTTGELKLDSAKADILYGLSVSDIYTYKKDPSLPNGWNFYGKPFFNKEGVEIRIQDVAGLFPINIFREDMLTKWLRGIGIGQDQAIEAASTIQRFKNNDDSRVGWSQSGDGNAPRKFQFLEHELAVIGISPADIKKISRTSTIYPTTFMNPLTMPYSLLGLYFGKDTVEMIREKREEGSLNARELQQITGYNDYENFFFDVQLYPMGLFSIEMSVVVDEIMVNRKMDVLINQNTQPPIYVLQERSL